MAHLTNIPYMAKEQIEQYLDTFIRVLYEEYGNNLPYIQVLIMGGSALGLKYNYRLTVDIDADVRFTGSKKMQLTG